MRTLGILCLLLIVSGSLSAQTIVIKDKTGKDVTGDTLSVVFYPGTEHGWTELAIYLYVQNTGNDSILLGSKKTEYHLQKDEYHSFCFGGMCFDSSVKVSTFLDPVAAGVIDSTFSGHFRFDDIMHKKGICLVAYTFYDEHNISNSAVVYVKYNTLNQLSEVQPCSKTKSTLKLWPSPASGFIDLDMPSMEPFFVEIYTSSGQQVFRESNTKRFDISNFLNGIYFARVRQGDNIMTAKFIKL